MKRRAFHLAGFVSMALLCLTTTLKAGDGVAGASFLNMGNGARALGMGEAYTTRNQGADALYWNPAALADRDGHTVMLTYNPTVEGSQFSQAAASFKTGPVGFGIGYNGFFHNSIDAYDATGERIGDFDASDQMGLIGAGFGSGVLKAGLSLKYIRSEIDNVSATTMAGDAGLLVTNPLSKKLNHALVVRNVGGKISFHNQDDPLPLTYIFGTGLEPGLGFTFTLDVGSTKGTGTFLATGAEWQTHKSDIASLAFRTGYTTRRKDVDDLAGTTFGAGFSVAGILLDYAWIPYGNLGDSHAVTLHLSF